MPLKKEILIELGAIVKSYKKNDMIFYEGDRPNYYYQIEAGQVRMFNAGQESKEFTQGTFFSGESFGNPALILNRLYPASAIAATEAILIRLPRERFLRHLENNPKILMEMLVGVCNMVYTKSLVSKALANDNPEDRIISYLNIYKNQKNVQAKTVIDVTRREIANATGLCVETVIRTISKMKEEAKIEIINKKLYY